VKIFMPDWVSRERSGLLRSLGAEVVPVSREQGGFLGCIRKSEELAASRENVFPPQQFSNEADVEAHEVGPGPEIWRQLRNSALEPDAFAAGFGTGGTVMGAGRHLRDRRRSLSVHPLEPAESPTLSAGRKVGSHRVQGLTDEFIPPIVNLEELERPVAVNDGDAILMAQRLAADLGLAAGISSGSPCARAISRPS
jgi:cysteine synthase A